ncbi:MAG: hypothetical protein QOJ53_1853, partial [Sphingomonadales bacterium]|nr:hypothetical protein [Sphingomonadales bacterium]
MPLTIPICFAPPAMFSWPITSTGISECSARTGLSVWSFHSSLRFLTFSFVSVFSLLFHPVRWLSPPSVVQSYSAARPDC